MKFFNLEMCEDLSSEKEVITIISLNKFGQEKWEREEARLKEHYDKVDAKKTK